MESEINTTSEEKRKFKRRLTRLTDLAISLSKNSADATLNAYNISQQTKTYIFESFYHLNMCSNVVQADLAILLEKSSLSKRSYEKAFYARIMALTVIEFVDDVNNLLGRDLLRTLNLVGFTEFIPTYKQINKDFANVKKLFGNTLRDIRNNSIAHKAKTADTLYKSVYEIDADTIIALGVAIYALSNSITNTGANLGNHIAEEFRKVGKQPNKIEAHLTLKIETK